MAQSALRRYLVVAHWIRKEKLLCQNIRKTYRRKTPTGFTVFSIAGQNGSRNRSQYLGSKVTFLASGSYLRRLSTRAGFAATQDIWSSHMVRCGVTESLPSDLRLRTRSARGYAKAKPADSRRYKRVFEGIRTVFRWLT